MSVALLTLNFTIALSQSNFRRLDSLKKLPEEFFSYIFHFYASSPVIAPWSVDNVVHVSRGIRQGDVFSSILFSYLSDLA